MKETWILLRGLARESAHWGAFPLAMGSEKRKIVLLDTPGNGPLWQQSSPISVAEMVAFLRDRALKERAPDSTLHLFALSLGGMVAAEWMHSFPGEIKSAVLVNSSFQGISPFWRRLRPGAWLIFLLTSLCPVRPWREWLILQLISNRQNRNPDLLKEWQEIQERHPVSLFNSLRQLWAASQFSAPDAAPPTKVLVLASQGDRLCHWKCSEAIAKLWKAELRVHPDAGHDLPIDDPAWVLQQINTQ